MPRKPKFRPEIRWIKLNPEQAVLQCDCYRYGQKQVAGPYSTTVRDASICNARAFASTYVWDPDGPSGTTIGYNVASS
jgi:hypothetical protein